MRLVIFFLGTLLISSFITAVSYSQSSWIRQDSLINYNYTISFANEMTGFYSGVRKRIHKTSNGGQNWFELLSSDSSNYRKVFCLDANNIFAGTTNNNFYVSTNSGLSWTKIPVVTGGTTLSSIFMCDLNTGYLTNYIPTQSNVLKTTNGGVNWNIVTTSPSFGVLNELYCVSKDTLFVCGSLSVSRSQNGGLSWNIVLNSALGTMEFKTINFINNLTGFTAGRLNLINPIIYKTTNGGNSWTYKIFNGPLESGASFYSIKFFDSNNGVAVGDSGIIYRTTNTGNTWIKQHKFYGIILDASYRSTNNINIALSNGTIYGTTNGGWEPPNTPYLIYPPNNFNYIKLTPTLMWEKAFFNSAQYSLQLSNDSNFNTTVLNINAIDSANFTIPANILTASSVYFWRVKSFNPQYTSSWSEIWKFGTLFPSAPNLISPSNNNTNVPSNQTMDWEDAVSGLFYNIQISKDSLFSQKITDSTFEFSYFQIPSPKLSVNTYYFWRVRAINVVGAGSWSEVWKFKSDDSPSLITPQNNDSGIVFNSLFDWTDYPNFSNYRIQISLDSLFNTVNVDNSYLYSSQYLLHNAMQQNQYYFWRVNARYNSNTLNTFWSEVRRFKTSVTYTGIDNKNEVPLEYKLYNNYPNPFNPSTNIRFSVLNSGIVKIAVYDLIGREVQTLVNEKLQPGIYETTFIGTELNSGVYFYRMITEGFTETKRMLLIK
ncbi:MAG: YCF48-related protein [Ignavibacteria bacterium]